MSITDKLDFDKELVSLESCDTAEAAKSDRLYDAVDKRFADELQRDAASVALARVRDMEGMRSPQSEKERAQINLAALRAVGADQGVPLEVRLKARAYHVYYMKRMTGQCRPSDKLLEFIQKK